MIRLLDGLVLLKEVDGIDGVEYTSAQLKKRHPDKVVVVRHASYIYYDVLCDIAKAQITRLDDYVHLGDLTENLCIRKDLFGERINFMKKTGAKFFDYAIVCGVRFIKIDEEFKFLFQHYQPFHASLNDANHLVHCKLIGDVKIGFF